MMDVLVFDIETVPDVNSGRRLHDLAGLDDKQVADIMFHLRRQETGGSDFLSLHLQQIVAISLVHRSKEGVQVRSLGSEQDGEKELVELFFEHIEKFSPTLVSWNGSGFDLPVLHYRALLHGISAPRYWETGDSDQSFRWNNYLSRFHYRHTDLMDVIAGFQSRASAPLGDIATMLGFPGKMGMDGSRVWDVFRHGEIKTIRQYCETDVLNTYLVYLRFELVRGNLNAEEYQRECLLLREVLNSTAAAHLQAFAAAWQAS
jgi:hypothetical protein